MISKKYLHTILPIAAAFVSLAMLFTATTAFAAKKVTQNKRGVLAQTIQLITASSTPTATTSKPVITKPIATSTQQHATTTATTTPPVKPRPEPTPKPEVPTMPFPTTTEKPATSTPTTTAPIVSFIQNGSPIANIYSLSNRLTPEQTKNMLGFAFAVAAMGLLLVDGRIIGRFTRPVVRAPRLEREPTTHRA